MEALFGDATGEIWRAISEQAAVQRTGIEIAGVFFRREELEAIGEYYRWLKKQKGFYLHCIDERLEENEKHVEKEVHVDCGACAAVGAATGLVDVAAILLARSTVDTKQEIHADMPNHRSMAILIDLNGAGAVSGDEREHLRAIGGLSFNVSLPMPLLEEYLDQSKVDQNLLFAALVKWSVQIARNIIGSAQNELRSAADSTILVVDKRGLDEHNPLVGALTKFVTTVEHGEMIEIRAV